MNLLYCGFNGFGQLSSVHDFIVAPLTRYPRSEIMDVSLCWSYMVVTSDEGVYISGYFAELSRQEHCLASPQDVAQVSCSQSHALVLEKTGKCWRHCSKSAKSTEVPHFTTMEDSNKKSDLIRQVSCGETFDVFVSDSGWAFAGMSHITSVKIEVTSVVCGNEHCLLLTSTGAVFSWGTGSRGQLGHGDLEREEQEARQVDGLAGLQVAKIAAGGWHSAAVTDTGDLYTWGWNNEGQLSLPCEDSQLTAELKKRRHEVVSVASEPTLVECGEVSVKDISCGCRHTVVLLDDGCVKACGWNAYGQLGVAPHDLSRSWQMIPLKMPTSERAVLVKCGGWSTAVLVTSQKNSS